MADHLIDEGARVGAPVVADPTGGVDVDRRVCRSIDQPADGDAGLLAAEIPQCAVDARDREVMGGTDSVHDRAACRRRNDSEVIDVGSDERRRVPLDPVGDLQRVSVRARLADAGEAPIGLDDDDGDVRFHTAVAVGDPLVLPLVQPGADEGRRLGDLHWVVPFGGAILSPSRRRMVWLTTRWR